MSRETERGPKSISTRQIMDDKRNKKLSPLCSSEFSLRRLKSADWCLAGEGVSCLELAAHVSVPE